MIGVTLYLLMVLEHLKNKNKNKHSWLDFCLPPLKKSLLLFYLSLFDPDETNDEAGGWGASWLLKEKPFLSCTLPLLV